MAEQDAKKQQGDLSSKLMTDVLSVLQNPGALPPLPSREPGISVGEFTPTLKMPEVPSAPEAPPEPGTGTRLGRAAAAFLAGLSSPELGAALVARFAQQDQMAAERVQQDFANKMAVVQAQRQGLEAQAAEAQQAVEAKQTAEELAQRKEQLAYARQQDKIRNAIDALNLMMRDKELQARGMDAGSSDLQLMRLEMDQIQFMRDSFEQQLKGLAPQVPTDLAKNPMAQMGVLGQETYLKILKGGGSPYEAALKVLEGKSSTAIAQAKAQFRESPAFTEWKKTLSLNGQRLADQLVGTAPDPITGDKGDPAGQADAVVGLAEGTTTDGRNSLVAVAGELAKQYVAEGRFPTVQEAEEFLADLWSKGIPPDRWNVETPAVGSVRRDIRRQPPEAFAPPTRLTPGPKGAPEKPLAIPPVKVQRGR